MKKREKSSLLFYFEKRKKEKIENRKKIEVGNRKKWIIGLLPLFSFKKRIKGKKEKMGKEKKGKEKRR